MNGTNHSGVSEPLADGGGLSTSSDKNPRFGRGDTNHVQEY